MKNHLNLDWVTKGYFFDHKEIEQTPDWMKWLEIFENAKKGNFSNTSNLVDILVNTKDPVLERMCCLLIGDAGSEKTMHQVLEFSKSKLTYHDPLDLYTAMDICNALAACGKLSYIEHILGVYRFFLSVSASDIHLLSLDISSVLEKKWDTISSPIKNENDFPIYKQIVTDRVDELAKAFGSKSTNVFLGDLYCVRNVAEQMLQHLGNSDFESAMHSVFRRKIEASTGINCDCFFKESKFKPLDAAAVLERFLDSDYSTKFMPGKRYFFGNQIP
jgi:hypothetical protein